jgi:LysM repeat protein
MNLIKTPHRIFVFFLATLLLAGCGKASSSAETPAGSPAPGDWVAIADFGRLVFTVDDTATKITKISNQFSDWTCGSWSKISGTIETGSDAPITDGQFSVEENFGNLGNLTMTFSGKYSAADQKFSGTWEGSVSGSQCSGTWEATEHYEIAPTVAPISTLAGPTITSVPPTPTGVTTPTIVVPTITSVPPTSTPAGPFVYIVAQGDTCSSIAAKFKVDLQLLKTINNLDPSCPISVGQQLIIPGPGS